MLGLLLGFVALVLLVHCWRATLIVLGVLLVLASTLPSPTPHHGVIYVR
jgi:hypothetical protein